MSGAGVLRPGYSPAETRSRANRAVLAEHATTTAFLWKLRERALRAPHYKLKHLARLDERLSAHVAGLRQGGAVALAIVQAEMEDANPGTVFGLTYLAFHCGDTRLMNQAIQVALAEPALRDPFVSALAWLPLARVLPALERLSTSEHAAVRRVAVSVYGVRRLKATRLLADALGAADAALKSRALRSAGETGCRDLLDRVSRAVGEADPLCRLRAIEASAVLGSQNAAEAALDLAESAPEHADAALEICIRCSSLMMAKDVVRSLIGSGQMRRAISSVGALGDPLGVPWLLDCMNEPRHARLAGESFASITGADLAYLGLKQDPSDLDAEDDLEADADLTWPNPVRVAEWWGRNSASFIGGRRYLGGRPIGPDGLAAVLRSGYQRDRRRAAFELARHRPDAILFPVDERADRQSRRLAG
jgi:uncharacterized protein (TIGR02270 family)